MIRIIEALNFRCLRYIKQRIDNFQILVGPNSSGKTTFLDTVTFLGNLLSGGLDHAVTEVSSNFDDLLFRGQGDRFQLALEAEIPDERKKLLEQNSNYHFVRYEISIGMDQESQELSIFDEQVILMEEHSISSSNDTSDIFPQSMLPPESIMHPPHTGAGKKRVIRKKFGGNDNFYSEIADGKGKGGWAPSIKLGPRKSSLGNLPEDENNFPVSTWLRELLIEGTQKFMLNSIALRQSSRPGQGKKFKTDGSNLPWVIEELYQTDKERFRDWVDQIRTALPEIKSIETKELPDTKHRYLQILYEGGLKVPSWTVSDGTLRMLALTIPAFIPHFKGIYLIEEPENGIHPMAMETVFQCLRSVYGAQVLLATHSPVVLGCAETKDILCFKKDEAGATAIVSGPDHPKLKKWQGALNLADLYASGVLG